VAVKATIRRYYNHVAECKEEGFPSYPWSAHKRYLTFADVSCLCPGVQYRATSFVAKRIAIAVVETDGDGGIEIYVEPVAVDHAEGFITPWWEPCVSLQTVTAWRTATAT
jgi:hypothetical protein